MPVFPNAQKVSRRSYLDEMTENWAYVNDMITQGQFSSFSDWISKPYSWNLAVRTKCWSINKGNSHTSYFENKEINSIK